MASIKYNIKQLTVQQDFQPDILSDDEKVLVNSYDVNTLFDPAKNFIRLEVKSLDGTTIETRPNLIEFSLLQNAQTAGKVGASRITLDPVENIKSANLEGSDVLLHYKFLNTVLSSQKFGGDLFIKEISPDRTEIRLLSSQLTDEELILAGNAFAAKLSQESSFIDFYLYNQEDFIPCLNIKTDSSKGASIILKLADALPTSYSVNSTLALVEDISEPITFECTAEILEDKKVLPRLKGPNFAVEVSEQKSNSTEYFNYNELFSFPLTGSYYELYSLFNDSSAQISINHNDYSDFIHFSSAEERLRNFKYKLDLIHSYEDSMYSASLSGRNLQGISGSKDYYQGLISGIVNNFDHYDRYLYYESGSNSWPKSNSTKPHLPIRSTESDSITWYANQITSASNYDASNFDILTNTIPTFLREDSNNEPYLMFIHMIAQHFDNLWIYFKAVSDKYDADNRLNFGISKDLVKDAIESFGIKLYDSNSSLENLFASFVGETYNTGSEAISSVVTALSGSSNSYLQPVSKDAYQKEIYKRIYHNLPHLLKTKGTQRGLRALITCFGIPDDILEIRYAPGVKIQDEDYFGPTPYVSQSNGGIRVDNSGSFTTGSTLSSETSVIDKRYKYSEDSHEVHVGFNLNKQINDRLRAATTGSFNIDDYIGDPRFAQDSKYFALDKITSKVLSEDITWSDLTDSWDDANFEWDADLKYITSPKAFIRLLKFFDNSLFKLIKDFIPARATAATGLIIEPHVMDRSKAKTPEVSFTDEIYTASLSTYKITGSDGGSYPFAASQSYTTDYSASVVTPIGKVQRNVTGEEVRLTGEFSGSFLIVQDGELNKNNPLKKSAQPIVTMDFTSFFLSDPLPPSCTIALKVEYEGDFYQIYTSGSGFISQTYPTAIGSTGSLGLVHDYDTYEFFTLEALPTYPATLIGWYTSSVGGTAISTGSTLTIYKTDEETYGNTYYARFTS